MSEKNDKKAVHLIEGDLPHNVEAEENLLASILLDSDVMATAMTLVRPDDFFDSRYSVIFDAMTQLFTKNRPIDEVNLLDQLELMGMAGDVGGRDFLLNLAESVGTTVNAESYAQIIRDYGLMRRMIRESREIAIMGTSGEFSAQEYLDEAERKVLAVRDERGQSRARPIGELAVEAVDRIDRQRQQEHRITGIPTDYPGLDDMLLGLQPSDMVILAARPSMGKTSFAMNIALNAAKQGKGVLFFSLEMSSDQITNRFISIESKWQNKSLPLSRLRSATLGTVEMENLQAVSESMTNYKMIIDDSPNPSPLDIRSVARRVHYKGQCDLIVIDYLQLMNPISKRLPREQQIAEISRALKALAKELKIPVLALSQLNRGPESRPDKHPLLSDIRESGAIEQDADVIIFLYRDAYYNKDKEGDDEVEIIVAKQRNGPTGIVNLRFFKEFTLFVTPAMEGL